MFFLIVDVIFDGIFIIVWFLLNDFGFIFLYFVWLDMLFSMTICFVLIFIRFDEFVLG